MEESKNSQPPTQQPSGGVQAGAEAPAGQQFNLKPTETQTLVILRNNQQGAFAAVLSLLATERMGYPVTERTQFTLNAEMNQMVISELPAEVPVANAPAEQSPPQTPDEEPKSGAVAAK